MATDPSRRHPLWAHVHALTVLGEAGSFTAAAQRLGLSKAAMSQRVAELEAAAGVPLVRRTTRSVRLTEAGQQLADSTRGAFTAIEQAFSGVQDLADAPRGLLRVTAPVALARQQIVPHLPPFLRRYPELRLELDLSDRLSPLAQEGFDLAIRHTSTPPDTHVAWALCATHSVLVASPAYLQAHGAPQQPADLAGHAGLHYPRPGDTPVWQLEPVGGGARVSVPVHGPLAANNSEALREAALGGLGIALLPDFSAQAALAAGDLVGVLPGWQPVGAFGSHLWALRPHTAQVPRAVRLLVDCLREALAPGFGAGGPEVKRPKKAT
jgi:DNA-binding transcriptional LysR family regulator